MNNFYQLLSLLKKGAAFVAVLFLLTFTAGAATRTAVASGDWNTASTWSGNTVPVDNDDVIIPAAFTVTISGPVENPWGDNGVGFNTTHSYIEVSGKLLLATTSTYMKFYKSVKFLIKSGGVIQIDNTQGQYWNGDILGISQSGLLEVYIQSGGRFIVTHPSLNVFGNDELSINPNFPVNSGTQTGSFQLSPIPIDQAMSNGYVQITTSGLTAPTPAPGSSTTINSLNAINTTPTKAGTVNYTATFAAAVTGLASGNFSLTTTGTIAGASVGNPTTGDGGINWNVPVNTGSGSGNITLNLHAIAGLTPSVSNVPPDFVGATYAIDKTAPAAPSTPVLAAGSDSGTPTDNVTNIVRPTFQGTAESGASVSIYDTDGITVLGTATATGGNWSVATTGDLGPGHHLVSAKATDLAGNAGPASPTVDVLINTTLPGITVTAVPAVEETSNTFTISYNNVTGAPDLYSVSVAATNQMPGFGVVSNFSLNAPNDIVVNMPNTAHGTYDFVLSVRNQASGNSSVDIPFSLTVNAPPPPPTITVSGTMNAFSSCVGSASASQSFKVSGTNLTDDIIVNAPAGFEISKTDGGTYSSQLIFAQTSGTVGQQDVFVRITASTTGAPIGDINISSTGATDQVESISGSVNDIPAITLGAVDPVPTIATTFSLPYSNLSSGNLIYFISAGARALPGFSIVNGFAMVASPISVNIPANTTPGTYDFNFTIQNISSTCSSVVIPFTVTVLSNNAILTKIAVNPPIHMSQVTGPDYRDYTARVGNSVTSVTLTPISLNDNTLTVKVNNVSVPLGTSSAALPLNVGDNVITTVVTAADGITSNTYSLKITRLGEATLASLSISPKSALRTASGPDFKDYSTTVVNSVGSVTITPTTPDITNTITVNGVTVASGTASAAIPLNLGDNTITTIVSDGVTSNTYSVVVTRQQPMLTSIALTPATQLKTVSGTDFADYTATVANSVSSVTVTPTSPDALSMITVNNIPVASGTASSSIPLNVGENTITTVVVAHDGQSLNAYSIKVTRQAPAILANLTFSPDIPLSQVPGPDFRNYTSRVGNSTTSVTVTPKAYDLSNTITVNGIAVASGTASADLPLNAGDNIVTVAVGDGVVTNTYSVKITRLDPAVLASLTVNPKLPLRLVGGPDFKDYTATADNSVSSVTITPNTPDVTTTIKVNNVTVAAGTASADIPLNVGDNTITTTVTDGTTTNTYSMVITRLAQSGDMMAYQGSLDEAVYPAPVVVHQGISPNGDGKGDHLQIDNIAAYPDNKLQIMSRAGELVFEAKGYDNQNKVFDGHSTGGRLQQPGTYFYSLQYKAGNETKYKTGYFVLKY